MDAFDHLLHWKLTHGSHPFPGKDGGTCINEAAIVAAGFEYQAVRRVEDMPECFSRPICRLAMRLNDSADRCGAAATNPLRHATGLCRHTGSRAPARGIHPVAHDPPTHISLQVLEGALSIGLQAETFASDEVRARMEAVQRSTTVGSIADSPSFLKIKSWFETKGVGTCH